MSVLKQFLTQVKRSPVKGIVSGNQLADMDSAVSALAYAYFLTHHDDPVVPIINIPRGDFRLRRDIVEWLDHFGVVEDDLWFADDLNGLVADATKPLPLHLVDHCNLQGPEIIDLVKAQKLLVVLIIDHHADEGVFRDANPRIIGVAGLCSLRVWNYWHSVLGDQAEVPEITELMMAPLLIDTSNMTQKVEDVDRQALAQYDEVLARPSAQLVEGAATVRDVVYPKLKQAKKDVSGFLFEDILRKDYKQNTFGNYTIGFSSIGKLFEWLTKHYSNDDIVKDLRHLSARLGLDYVIMTCLYSDKVTGEHRRDFGEFHANDKKPIDFTHVIDVLQLTPYPEISIPEVDVWHQHDVNATRKTVVPVVHDTVLKYN